MPHLAFGFGTHICLGFPLARLEQVAFRALSWRWRTVEVDGPEPPWLNSLVFRGMTTLPVRVRLGAHARASPWGGRARAGSGRRAPRDVRTRPARPRRAGRRRTA
ncbi:MAG: hypothetical protein U0527_06580 [Candidatus Eisenbacteria bacterium]